MGLYFDMKGSTVAIIGGGVIGCGIALELAEYGFRDIYVFERRRDLRGENQSSRNSGVIHSGLYYPRETMPLKAELCVYGRQLLYQLCMEKKIPYKKIGKLIVATDKEELVGLEEIAKQGKINGVLGLQFMTPKLLLFKRIMVVTK